MKQRKNRPIAGLILCLLLVIITAMPSLAFDDVMLDSCDSASGWSGFKANKNDMIEGKGCIEFVVKAGTDAFVIPKQHSKKDASGANCLELDIWMSNADLAVSCSQFNLEITSSGTWDKEEIEWSIMDQAYATGEWTHLILPLKESDIDLSRVNFTRLFMLGISIEEDITLRVDNIRFTYRDDLAALFPEAVDPSEKMVINLAETSAPETAAVPETERPVVTEPGTSAPTESDVPAAETPETPSGGMGLVVAGCVLIAFGAVLLVMGLAKKKLLFTVIGVLVAVIGAVLLLVSLLSVGGASVTETEVVESDTAAAPVTEAPVIPSDDDDITTIYYKETVDLTLPRVTLGASPVSGGLSAFYDGAEPLKTMVISERDCTFLEYNRKDASRAYIYFDADEKTKAAYSGNLSLIIEYYCSERAALTLDYTKTDGSAASVEYTVTKLGNSWNKLSVTLPDAKLSGGVDGHDIKLSSKGAEFFRMAAVYLDHAPEITAPEGNYLVVPKYECGEYVVANYNVLNFGAKGDGRADDTAAIKDAIAAAQAAGGGTVFIPEGRYCMTEPIELPTGVMLIGELETGTANGTVLYVYCGKGKPEDPAFIKMPHGSAVRNIAFYYPEQRFVKGEPIPFPYTFEQVATEGLDIENVTLVNSYNGIDFSTGSDSLQTVRNLYGTVLNVAYHMNACYDIGRFENVCFSPKYWLECDVPNKPIKEQLENYMLINSIGMIVERIDWTYFADVKIEGYNIGFLARASAEGMSHGHLYNFEIVDCYNPLVIEDMAAYGNIISNSTFRAAGGEDAVAILLSATYTSDMSFVNCTIESEGKYAIVNNGTGLVTAVDSAVKAGDKAHATNYGKVSFINTEIAGEEVITADLPGLITDVDYNRYVYTKPASDAFIDMGAEPYSIKDGDDITEKLQAAIDSLKGKGGLIYLPNGTYYVEDAITVHAGIELRGTMDMPHNGIPATANIYSDFGRNDPDGEALFTLMEGAGMRGINFYYYNQYNDGVVPYSFTIRGNGKGVYLCNLLLNSSYNGVDLATYRCDEHYVEYLWGTPMNIGIITGGGSENGIVRDIQYTPNCNPSNWDATYKSIMTQGRPFVIGETKNQVFYHNFSYGGWKGIHVMDGAKDAYLIANGIDSGNFSTYIEGNATAHYVDTQLVNLNGKEMNYIVTDESFTGEVVMINTNLWGTSKGAIVMNGSGKLTMIGGRIQNAGAVMLEMNAGEAVLAAVQNATGALRADVMATNDIKSVTLIGCVLESGGKYRVDGVDASKMVGLN